MRLLLPEYILELKIRSERAEIPLGEWTYHQPFCNGSDQALEIEKRQTSLSHLSQDQPTATRLICVPAETSCLASGHHCGRLRIPRGQSYNDQSKWYHGAWARSCNVLTMPRYAINDKLRGRKIGTHFHQFLLSFWGPDVAWRKISTTAIDDNF